MLVAEWDAEQPLDGDSYAVVHTFQSHCSKIAVTSGDAFGTNPIYCMMNVDAAVLLLIWPFLRVAWREPGLSTRSKLFQGREGVMEKSDE